MGTIKNQKTQVRRAGSATTIAAAMAVTVMVCGCAASITSRNFDAKNAGDGIVYKLPVREYAVAVTYELVSCPAEPSNSTGSKSINGPGKDKPNDGPKNKAGGPCELSAEPAAAPERKPPPDNEFEVKAVDVAVSSELVPSKDKNDWFEIDPKTLNQVFSSVDPATIELSNGMLSTVGIKTTGATAQVIPLAAQLAGPLGVRFEGKQPHCTEAARASLASLVTSKAERKARQDCVAWAEKEMLRAPSEDAERRVKLARERLAQAAEKYSKVRDTGLRKTIVYRVTPGAAPNCKTSKAVPADDAICASPIDEELAEWIAVESMRDQDSYAAIKNAFNVRLEARNPSVAGVQADRPTGGNSFAGVYYRRPATATIVIAVASGQDDKVFRVLDTSQAIPQLGTLQRVAMKGSAFGSRNISVAFDETGQLKKYELTSKGMAEAMTASAKELDAAFAKPEKPSEIEKLTAEVNLLTKKKELIDAKAALEAAESGAGEP